MSSGQGRQKNKRRKKDEWVLDHVKQMGEVWECGFCKHQFDKGTSPSRVMLHLSGDGGSDVIICKEVSPEVQQKAYHAVGGSSKRPKAMPRLRSGGARNISLEANNEVAYQGRDGGMMKLEGMDAEPEIGQGANGGQDMIEEEEPLSAEMADVCTTSNSKVKLLTARLVGKAFQRNIEQVCSWLLEDGILRVGVYGMAGVGKTEMAKHIHNLLLEKPDVLCVCWVTLSRDFSIGKVQNAIARAVHVDLSNEDDEIKRAAVLSMALKKKRAVVILDDVWDYIDLKQLGLPECRLIVTTQSLDVCQRIGCQKIARVEPLSEDEGWTLFQETFGKETNFSEEVLEIAKSMARTCGGLPLGITSMALLMRGKVDIRTWRHAMQELKGALACQYNMEVFHRLKRSYDYLNDWRLQQCFLYCALFADSADLGQNELLTRLIDGGIIKEMESGQAEYDLGYTMLDRLYNVCLLTNVEYPIKMHPLIRCFAFQMLREKSLSMIEAGKGLVELPDEVNWTEDLVLVSLSNNDIKRISSDYSPRCPNISTLLLRNNLGLEYIPDPFFNNMQGLKILDLSETSITELPSSVSNLKSLIALIVDDCYGLTLVPSLAKLTALKTLNLNRTEIMNLPQGLEFLCNLRHLNLELTSVNVLPTGVLPKLSRLQELNIFSFGRGTPIAGELACLRKLETLVCDFCDPTDLNHYLSRRPPRLSQYYLVAGGIGYWDPPRFKYGKEVVFSCCNIGEKGAYLTLPEDVEELCILECHDVSSLCDATPSLSRATCLKTISVERCQALQSLLSLSGLSSNSDALQSIEQLIIFDLRKLEVLISVGGTPSPPWPSNCFFSNLKIISVSDCPSLRMLFPLGLLPNLQNLEKITVGQCEQMEELVETEGVKQEEGILVSMVSGNISFSLPKLRCLALSGLPRLKSIYRGSMICDSLDEVRVLNCPMLKRMPISLPSFENGRPSHPLSLRRITVSPKEWWDTVQWDQPDAKDVILPLCSFAD